MYKVFLRYILLLKYHRIIEHYYLLKEYSNVRHALLEIKNHALAYLKQIPNMKECKLEIINSKTEDDFLKIIDKIYTQIN